MLPQIYHKGSISFFLQVFRQRSFRELVRWWRFLLKFLFPFQWDTCEGYILSHSDTANSLALAGGVLGIIMSFVSLYLFLIPFPFFFGGLFFGPGWAVVGLILSIVVLALRTSLQNNPLGIGITYLVLSTVYGAIGILPLAALLIFIAGIFGIVEHHSRTKRARPSDPSTRWKRWGRPEPPTAGPVPKTRSTVEEVAPTVSRGQGVCSTCGSRLEPEDRYCVNCGAAR
jgi:hypothetical protein